MLKPEVGTYDAVFTEIHGGAWGYSIMKFYISRIVAIVTVAGFTRKAFFGAILSIRLTFYSRATSVPQRSSQGIFVGLS